MVLIHGGTATLPGAVAACMLDALVHGISFARHPPFPSLVEQEEA